MQRHINISFAGRDVVDKDFAVITSRSVKTVFAHFDFDAEWDEYTSKTAMFINGSTVVAQILDAENSCEVPWEVLKNAGVLTVGVVGQNGEKIFPSVKVIVTLVDGICTDGTAPKEPSPDVYEQIVQIMQQAQKDAQSVREDADNGKFNGKDGSDYILTAEDKQEITNAATQAVLKELEPEFEDLDSALAAIIELQEAYIGGEST